MRCLLERGAYFKAMEIDKINVKTLTKNPYFKIKILAYFFTVNKQNIMKKSKYQQYLHCFIVCILFPYAFWFSY